jgi:hypothetical protein
MISCEDRARAGSIPAGHKKTARPLPAQFAPGNRIVATIASRSSGLRKAPTPERTLHACKSYRCNACLGSPFSVRRWAPLRPYNAKHEICWRTLCAIGNVLSRDDRYHPTNFNEATPGFDLEAFSSSKEYVGTAVDAACRLTVVVGPHFAVRPFELEGRCHPTCSSLPDPSRTAFVSGAEVAVSRRPG